MERPIDRKCVGHIVSLLLDFCCGTSQCDKLGFQKAPHHQSRGEVGMMSEMVCAPFASVGSQF